MMDVGQGDLKGCLEEQPSTAPYGLSSRATTQGFYRDQVFGVFPAPEEESGPKDPAVLRTDLFDQVQGLGCRLVSGPTETQSSLSGVEAQSDQGRSLGKEFNRILPGFETKV